MNEVKDNYGFEDDKLFITRSQDVSQILKDNHNLRDTLGSGTKGDNWKLAGRIPLVVAEQWSKECGAGIGTQEFGEYVKKKLKDSNYAYLRVCGY